jgi:hypothetical protein
MKTHTSLNSTRFDLEHNATTTDGLFVSFAITMIVVSTICLVLALLLPAAPWTQTASAAAAAWTEGLC